jgi:crotonobetainyl-CoA:carnitine CoA-transferase CaiB-like acyl-CoA transferase
VLTGTYAFGAIAAALYHRRVTGRGRWSTCRCSRAC